MFCQVRQSHSFGRMFLNVTNDFRELAVSLGSERKFVSIHFIVSAALQDVMHHNVDQTGTLQLVLRRLQEINL